MKTVTVGRLQMTVPALVVAVLGALIGLGSIVHGQALTGFVFMFLFFLQSYTINCTVVGNCTTWAWVLAVAYALTGATHFLRKY